MSYKPDLWTLVRITDQDKNSHVRILASWYGGYGGSDSWRLSSGCLEPTIEGDLIVWPQSSGSTYVVAKGNIGMSNYTRQILNSIIETSKEVTIEVIEPTEFSSLVALNYF